MRLVFRFLAPLALLLAFLAPAGTATAYPADSGRYTTTDFDFDVNTCNGESVEVKGTAHMVTKMQKDLTLLGHFNLRARGVGSQGNEYVMNWNEKGQFEANGDFSFAQRFLAISKGSGPNQAVLVHFDSHGEPTFEVDCRG
jgi:hypothetical protein